MNAPMTCLPFPGALASHLRRLALLLAAFAMGSASLARPNLVLITADDLGLQLGCYGDEGVQTPHIDRLAAEGTLFENGYVTQASCSPSRASMLTGLYPHQNGMLGLAHRGYELHRGVPLLPNLLREAGYFTMALGKVHVNPDEWLDWDARHRGVQDTTIPSVVERETARLLDEAEQAGRPFFFLYSLFDPHRIRNERDNARFFDQREGVPSDPLTSDAAPIFPAFGNVDTPEIRREIRGYYNSVMRVDHLVGLLRAALEARGLWENTLILFVGDHGPPFSRGKTTIYEFGAKIPFLARGPGVEAGHRRTELVSTIDLLPTFLAAAGGEVPSGLPGERLQPLLADERTAWRDYLATEFNAHAPNAFAPQRAIRGERFKLIRNYLPGRSKPGLGVDGCALRAALGDPAWQDDVAHELFRPLREAPAFELYDLQVDPLETNNLYLDINYVEKFAELRRELEAWQVATADWALDEDYLRSMVGYHDRWKRYLKDEAEQLRDEPLSAPYNRINSTPFRGQWKDGR